MGVGPARSVCVIKNLILRGLPALALCALPVLAAPAAHSAPVAATATPAAAGVTGPGGMRAPLLLFEAIDRLPVAVEHREGYKRELYKHWNKGLLIFS